MSNLDANAVLQEARHSMSNFDANAILRGAQLTIVGGRVWLVFLKARYINPIHQLFGLYKIRVCSNMSTIDKLQSLFVPELL